MEIRLGKGTLISFIALLVVVAGCSSNNITGEQSTAKAPEKSAEKPADKPADKPVKIEYFQQKVETVATVNKLIAKFKEKNPEITVEQNNVPNAQNVWTMRLSVQDAPDIFTNWPTAAAFQKAAKDGFVADLTGDPLLNNVRPDMVELSKINGKNYIVPLALATYGVYYNMDMFKELGLAIPKTYEELIQVAKKVQGAGKTPFLFPDKDVTATRQIVGFMMGLDIPQVDRFLDDVMKGKAHIQDKPEMKEFAKKVLEIRTYGQKDSLGLSRDDAVREFALGKAAMYFQGIWSIQPIKEANPKLNFAMFPFPANTAEATKTEVFVDTALGLPKGGKNEKASRKFVEFMASKEAAQIYVDEAGYPSAIKGVENSAKEIKSLSDLISAGKVYLPVSTNWLPGMTDDVGKATQELVAKQSIDDYLVKLDSIFFNKANQ